MSRWRDGWKVVYGWRRRRPGEPKAVRIEDARDAGYTHAEVVGLVQMEQPFDGLRTGGGVMAMHDVATCACRLCSAARTPTEKETFQLRARVRELEARWLRGRRVAHNLECAAGMYAGDCFCELTAPTKCSRCVLGDAIAASRKLDQLEAAEVRVAGLEATLAQERVVRTSLARAAATFESRVWALHPLRAALAASRKLDEEEK